jgi:hypothetical protein
MSDVAVAARIGTGRLTRARVRPGGEVPALAPGDTRAPCVPDECTETVMLSTAHDKYRAPIEKIGLGQNHVNQHVNQLIR